MKLSPLQLARYFVTDIGCKANPQFNPEREMQGALEQFSVNVRLNALPPEKDVSGHSWSLEMEIAQRKKEDQNFPYEFHISLLGIFTSQEGPNLEMETTFVQVNGSSSLYGMAREHIRALTAAGPWSEIILPTVSFYENNDKEAASKVVPAVSPEAKTGQ